MLAGGTGITPMYQVAAAILKNPLDRTEVPCTPDILFPHAAAGRAQRGADNAVYPLTPSIELRPRLPVWPHYASTCLTQSTSGVTGNKRALPT